MTQQEYRFKNEIYNIDGIDISAFIICSGFGYDFETYCCKNCGEIFVIELEMLFWKKISFDNLVHGKNCPKCLESLSSSLVKYPENVVYKSELFKNHNNIDRANFENTMLKAVFKLE